jgi:hypothetical protein
VLTAFPARRGRRRAVSHECPAPGGSTAVAGASRWIAISLVVGAGLATTRSASSARGRRSACSLETRSCGRTSSFIWRDGGTRKPPELLDEQPDGRSSRVARAYRSNTWKFPATIGNKPESVGAGHTGVVGDGTPGEKFNMSGPAVPGSPLS